MPGDAGQRSERHSRTPAQAACARRVRTPTARRRLRWARRSPLAGRAAGPPHAEGRAQLHSVPKYGGTGSSQALGAGAFEKQPGRTAQAEVGQRDAGDAPRAGQARHAAPQAHVAGGGPRRQARRAERVVQVLYVVPKVQEHLPVPVVVPACRACRGGPPQSEWPTWYCCAGGRH